jgi:hypothetical protein
VVFSEAGLEDDGRRAVPGADEIEIVAVDLVLEPGLSRDRPRLRGCMTATTREDQRRHDGRQDCEHRATGPSAAHTPPRIARRRQLTHALDERKRRIEAKAPLTDSIRASPDAGLA